jgi:polyisoprenoid-binding protein YceI
MIFSGHYHIDWRYLRMQKLSKTILLLGFLTLVLTACSLGITQEVEQPGSELAAPTIAAPAEESAVEEPAADTGSAKTVFTIDQSASQARFELDEELRGQPKTVVGTTDQVAGQIAFNLSDLSTAQVGQILINAGMFTTDSSLRNRAIRDRILNAGDFELITFTPTAVNGLPAEAAVGEEITFTIDGDLTIRDITNPVTFEVTATAISAEQISGTAGTVINRADYNLNIPSVPNVANVEEQVELILDFVANAS